MNGAPHTAIISEDDKPPHCSIPVVIYSQRRGFYTLSHLFLTPPLMTARAVACRCAHLHASAARAQSSALTCACARGGGQGRIKIFVPRVIFDNEGMNILHVAAQRAQVQPEMMMETIQELAQHFQHIGQDPSLAFKTLKKLKKLKMLKKKKLKNLLTKFSFQC